MSDRRVKGLCYFCDEKYTPGHYLKHKKGQIYLMELDEQDDELVDESEEEDEEEKVQIYVNVIAGVSNYKTMRVKGMYGKRPLFILIDLGSTHNFIDKCVAEKLGCKLEPTGLTKVVVADGSTLDVASKVEGFKWSFQNSMFQTDVMVIPLGCCDMVLGI